MLENKKVKPRKLPPTDEFQASCTAMQLPDYDLEGSADRYSEIT